MPLGQPILIPLMRRRGGTGEACIARLAVLADAERKERNTDNVIPWAELTPIPNSLSDGQGSPPTVSTFVVVGRPLDGEFSGPLKAVCSRRDVAEGEAEKLQLDTQSFVYGVFAQVGETEPRKACAYRNFM